MSVPEPIAALLAEFPRIVAEEQARIRAKKGSYQKKARTCEEQAKLSKRSKANRRSGATNELNVCGILRPVCPDVCRALGQSRDGGRDLENTAPFCFELKFQARPDIMAAFRQADAAKKDGEIAAAITKAKNKGEQMITLRLSDFVPIMAGFIAYRDSVAIELVVGTEEDEREAEKALSQSDAVARTLPLFGGAA